MRHGWRRAQASACAVSYARGLKPPLYVVPTRGGCKLPPVVPSPDSDRRDANDRWREPHKQREGFHAEPAGVDDEERGRRGNARPQHASHVLEPPVHRMRWWCQPIRQLASAHEQADHRERREQVMTSAKTVEGGTQTP